MPSPPPKLFLKGPLDRLREDMSRDMVWCMTFAQAAAAIAAIMKPEQHGRATDQAGRIADAAVIEYEKRCEHIDVQT